MREANEARAVLLAFFFFSRLGALGCAGCEEAAAKPSPRAAAAAGSSDAAVSEARSWKTVLPEALCTTSGATRAAHDAARFSVDSPTFRAIAPVVAARAELDFVYEGGTTTTRALGSGTLRHQIGLKWMARNPCNLVYAMWRIEDAGPGAIVVQTKRNPNQATSAECGNRGYTTVRPRSTSALPSVALHSRHVLRAEIEGETFRVRVDGVVAWEGALPNESIAADAPLGIRSDNVRFEGELRTEAGVPVACGHAPSTPSVGGRAEDDGAGD